MRNKFCLPLRVTSLSELYGRVEEAQFRYQFLEVWLETLPAKEHLAALKIAEQFPERIIFNLKNVKKVDSLMKPLLDSMVWLDLDLKEGGEILASLPKDRSAKLVISFHDFQSQPEEVYLLKLLNKMDAIGADVRKLAVTPRTNEEVLTLLSLRQRLQSAIIVGMGDLGRVTRVLGAMWGNVFDYAPETREDSNAPGQLTRDDFEAALKILCPATVLDNSSE